MSGTAGTVVKQHAGTLRTYPQAVRHQVASSVSNLTTLAENRREVLLDFVADRRQAMQPGPIAAWVLPETRYPERTRHLVDLLRRQGIDVLRNATEPVQLDGLHDARSGKELDALAFPGPVWLVPLDQPAAPLVRVLLDPHVPMEAPFLREEREHLERGKGTRLYEITAWSLPLAFDVDAYWPADPPAVGWQQAELPAAAGRPAGGSGKPFGYLIDGVRDGSSPALAEMLQTGLAVRVAEKPFRVEGEAYERGALLVKTEGNPADLAERLAAIAARSKVDVRAVSTAKAEQGPDLGGEYFHPLVAPRVGIWTDWPVSPSNYGALWNLMDEELGLRFTALSMAFFPMVDLERYNVLVFPPAMGDARLYRAQIGDEGVERIKRWIEAGGTAIGIGDGAAFLADVSGELTKTRLRSQALERYPPPVVGPGSDLAEQAGPFRAAGLRAPPAEEDEPEGDGKKKKAKSVSPADPLRGSPYDVAPVLGPGARPFAEGYEQGTPVTEPPVDLKDWLAPALPPGQQAPKKEDLERADERLRRFAPRGTFVRIELDPHVWLNWGLPERMPALVRNSDTLVAEPPVQVAARFAGLEELHLGGLLWPEAAGRLARTAYATREQLGRGQVILFLEEPEFRGWTLGTRRLLVNALLLGPGLGTRWSTPW
jgi:hypothetical protein